MKNELLLLICQIALPSLFAFRAGVLMARARARRISLRERAEYREARARAIRDAFNLGFAQAKRGDPPPPRVPEHLLS